MKMLLFLTCTTAGRKLRVFFFFFKGNAIYSFYYLWLCWVFVSCARAFSSCGKRGPLFIVVRGPHTIAASLVAEHKLQTRRLRSCGSRAQLLRGMWDLPRPGLEPVSPALAGRLSTTVPPGKPKLHVFNGRILFYFWVLSVLEIVDSIPQVPLIKILKENTGAESWNLPLADAPFSLEVRVVAQPHWPGGRDTACISAVTFPPSHSHDPNHTFKLRLLLYSFQIFLLLLFPMLSCHWSN